MSNNNKKSIKVYVLSNSDGEKIYSTNLKDICTMMEEKTLNWDFDDLSLRFQIRKEIMSPEQFEKIPEYNG